MRASVTIHVETLWTNRAELMLEAELDNPHSETNQQVVSMMFDAARLMPIIDQLATVALEMRKQAALAAVIAQRALLSIAVNAKRRG